MKSRTERFSAEKLAALRRQRISRNETSPRRLPSLRLRSQTETWKRQPTVDVAERIANALGVGVAGCRSLDRHLIAAGFDASHRPDARDADGGSCKHLGG